MPSTVHNPLWMDIHDGVTLSYQTPEIERTFAKLKKFVLGLMENAACKSFPIYHK
jgi:hypothetical protein